MKKMKDIWEKYEKIEMIGRGAYADVYRAKNINTGEYVAIKEIKKIKIENKTILKKNVNRNNEKIKIRKFSIINRNN